MIKIENFSKVYPHEIVFHNLNLNLPNKGIIGILGANGSGKTTLFKTMTGLVPLFSGKMVINDEDIITTSKGNRINNNPFNYISYFPDSLKLYSVTILELLEITSWMYKDFNINKAKDILSKIKLDVNLFTKQLSIGQKVMLNFTLTASRDVEIYFLDEPFDGIDLEYRELILDNIVQFIDTSEKLLLISSHEIGEIQRLIDEFVILANGHIIDKKTMGELNETGIDLIDYFLTRVGNIK